MSCLPDMLSWVRTSSPRYLVPRHTNHLLHRHEQASGTSMIKHRFKRKEATDAKIVITHCRILAHDGVVTSCADDRYPRAYKCYFMSPSLWFHAHEPVCLRADYRILQLQLNPGRLLHRHDLLRAVSLYRSGKPQVQRQPRRVWRWPGAGYDCKRRRRRSG
jgi:hypothetical protein